MKFINNTSTLLLPSLLLASAHAGNVWSTIANHVRARPDTSSMWGPNHENLGFASLDYNENHPFERNRELQYGSEILDYDSEPTTTFQQARIRYITEPLESRGGETLVTDKNIDAIMDSVLPMVRQTFEQHLKVFPVAGSIPINQDICSGLVDGLIPSALEGSGVDDADHVVIVTAQDIFMDRNGTETVFCRPGVAGSAFSCVLDQYDRPIVSLINFCLPDAVEEDQTPASSDENVTASIDTGKYVVIGLHEVAHAFGMSRNLYPYFRSPNGEPLTPRPLQPQNVTCTNGSTESLVFPSESVLQMDVTEQGDIYYDFVTPRVQQVVRNHYDCQSLKGARLENAPSRSCINSHWDERTLYNELMSGTASRGTIDIFSPLSWALLEDSGWYQVDYQDTRHSTFGFGAGCDFVNKDCIVDNAVPSYAKGDFCDTISVFDSVTGSPKIEDNEVLCDPSNVAFASCDLFDVEDDRNEGLTFSNESQRYFTDQPTWQGINRNADYCPIPIWTFGVSCEDASTATELHYKDEAYGPGNRCVNVSPEGGKRAFAGCFPTECNAETQRVVVAGHSCEYDFQEFSVLTVDNEIATATCPKLSTVCPQFSCQGGCSGRGVCNFKTNQCECSNPNNKSPICSDVVEESTTEEEDESAAVDSSSTSAPTSFPKSSGSISTFDIVLITVGTLAAVVAVIGIMLYRKKNVVPPAHKEGVEVAASTIDDDIANSLDDDNV